MDAPGACPLCGGEPTVDAVHVERGWWCVEVSCECGVSISCGGTSRAAATSAAVAAWNIQERRNDT